MTGAVQGRTIVIRKGEEVVSAVFLPRGCGDVLVGRSRNCELRTPEDDMSVSGRHARLFWQGDDLCLEDVGSSNGTYLLEERLSEARKVTTQTVFAIGNCVLTCEEVKCHRLEWSNGKNAGSRVPICPKAGASAFTIGLDPESDLRLVAPLVSRQHAQLEIGEDGTCWLKDCASRNGTFLNGELLKEGARQLKDNDRIQIAQFEFRFLDKGSRHPFSVSTGRIVLRLALVLLVLSAVSVGLRVWYSAKNAPAAVGEVGNLWQELRTDLARGAFEKVHARLKYLPPNQSAPWQMVDEALKIYQQLNDVVRNPDIQRIDSDSVECIKIKKLLDDADSFVRRNRSELANYEWLKPLVAQLENRCGSIREKMSGVNKYKQK